MAKPLNDNLKAVRVETDDRDPYAFPRSRNLICSASNDGQVTIHRRGHTGMVLTAEEANIVYAFLDDSMPIWSRATA